MSAMKTLFLAVVLAAASAMAFAQGDYQIGAQDVLTMVPEPGSIAVWSLLGVVGLAAGWKRRKRNEGKRSAG